MTFELWPLQFESVILIPPWCSRMICMHAPQLRTEYSNLSLVMTAPSCYLPRAGLHLLYFKFPSCFPCVTWRSALCECLYINYAKQPSIILEIKLADSAWGRWIRLFFFVVLTPFSLNMQIFISVCFYFHFYILNKKYRFVKYVLPVSCSFKFALLECQEDKRVDTLSGGLTRQRRKSM